MAAPTKAIPAHWKNQIHTIDTVHIKLAALRFIVSGGG